MANSKSAYPNGNFTITDSLLRYAEFLGYGDIHLTAPRYSPIYGDPRSEASFVSYARSGGVLVTGIALADERSPC